jgi:hypothetical protein
VTSTFGGTPFRQIETYVDGVKQGSSRCPVTCLAKELEFFQGLSGLVAEVRMYNRILGQDEIAALSRGLGSQASGVKP